MGLGQGLSISDSTDCRIFIIFRIEFIYKRVNEWARVLRRSEQ